MEKQFELFKKPDQEQKVYRHPTGMRERAPGVSDKLSTETSEGETSGQTSNPGQVLTSIERDPEANVPATDAWRENNPLHYRRQDEEDAA